ncbi:MAG: hypothetical protein IPP29_16885 [Bacteroidetes bacterium]|nr:hypothetical protein [Bacteroidota bacterium]
MDTPPVFEYNDKAHLIKIIDSAGRILTIENDSAGHITSINALIQPMWTKLLLFRNMITMPMATVAMLMH